MHRCLCLRPIFLSHLCLLFRLSQMGSSLAQMGSSLAKLHYFTKTLNFLLVASCLVLLMFCPNAVRGLQSLLNVWYFS